MTTDGAWHEAVWTDSSLVVPIGVKALLLRVNVLDGTPNIQLSFRAKGYAAAFNISQIGTQVANVTNCADLIVDCDADGKINYMAYNTTWTAILIVVAGWWV